MIFRDSAHFRHFFQNWNGRCTDHKTLDLLCKKSYKVYFCDPVMYNYMFVAALASGIAIATSMRHLLFNPDVHFRRGDSRKLTVDRWQTSLYSLPYFNNKVRNFSIPYINSWVDNEPDYQGAHPWGIRPERHQHYARFPLALNQPHRYTVDDPTYEQRLHGALEKKYLDMGYYKDRVEEKEEAE